MDTEIVYLGHDNTIDLLLKASSSAASLTSVTKITATFDDTLITNSSASTGTITWAGASYSTGEVRMTLGAQTIDPGRYDVPIIVYDATWTTGIVWDIVPIRVRAEVEGVAP
jgi:hypothetical protein